MPDDTESCKRRNESASRLEEQNDNAKKSIMEKRRPRGDCVLAGDNGSRGGRRNYKKFAMLAGR